MSKINHKGFSTSANSAGSFACAESGPAAAGFWACLSDADLAIEAPPAMAREWAVRGLAIDALDAQCLT